jgi:Xaa-Pro aminopeptidase
VDLAALQSAVAEQGLDGWLLYDFRRQNPTAAAVLGLGEHMLTRRWFYLIPARGTPQLLVHAIEQGSFPKFIPGDRHGYASWQSLRDEVARLLAAAGGVRIAMEYCPMAAIPYLSRVDAGTIELVRSLGAEIVSSGDLIQQALCRYSAAQVESHVRAMRVVERAKDAAFELIGTELRAGGEINELGVQAILMRCFGEAGLLTDHPPIVAVNAHAGDPHYAPTAASASPIRRGDSVLIDLWAVEAAAGSVYADITWMGFCGETPSDQLMRMFGTVVEGRDLGLATVERAWRDHRVLRGWEVDRAVRDHIASRGFGDYFIHRTGHSLGMTAPHGDGANLDDLETHDTREIIGGTAFTIEPGIYMPQDNLGVRSEINVVMTPSGPTVFSAIQRDIVRIGV